MWILTAITATLWIFVLRELVHDMRDRT